MKKILYIIDSLERGGKERRLVELLKSLSHQSQYELYLYILNGKIEYNEVLSLNVEIVSKKRSENIGLYGFVNIFNIVLKLKPDIIHTWSSTSSVLATPANIVLRTKLVNGMISTSPYRVKPWSKLWIKAKISFPVSSVIISNTFSGLSVFNVSLIKGICIHNGFDFNRVDKNLDIEKIKLQFGFGKKKIIGMVANFTHNKDYNIFIKAALEITKTRDNILFVAIGDGPTLKHIKSKANSLEINNIKFLGRQKKIEGIVSCFDIGIMLTNSNVHGEGISNSIMEYMALGKPVIATDSGGTSEIVINNQTGYLIKDNDENELVEKINHLLDDNNLRNNMGQNSYERILNQFNNTIATEKYIAMYNNLFF